MYSKTKPRKYTKTVKCVTTNKLSNNNLHMESWLLHTRLLRVKEESTGWEEITLKVDNLSGCQKRRARGESLL